MEENVDVKTTKENTEKSFDEVLEDTLTDKLREAYNKGVVDGAMAGWNACVKSIYEKTKDMTSAKKIHKLLSKANEEVKQRMENKNLGNGDN